MSYLFSMPFIVDVLDAFRRSKPRRCAYRIVSWEVATGEIMGICDPLKNMMLDPNEMVITARWPWKVTP